MKEAFRVVSLVFITLLYCFAAGTFTAGSSSNFSAEYNQSGIEGGSVFSAQTSNLLQHTTQLERTVNTYTCSEISSFKTSFSRLAHPSQWDEKSLINQCVAFLFWSKGLVIKSSTSNIIFPFHYFW